MELSENADAPQVSRRAVALKFVRLQLNVAESRMNAARAADTPKEQKSALADARTSLHFASFALADLGQYESDVRELVERFKTLSRRCSYAPR